MLIGGQTDGYERDRVLDSQLSGLFKHIHGGRDVECSTKERLVLDTFDNAIESYIDKILKNEWCTVDLSE